MTITDVFVMLLVLGAGAFLGWFLTRRWSAARAAGEESRAITDARLDAQTARAEASRAREEAAASRTEVAQRIAEQANMRAAVAEAQRQVADERTATALATSATSEALSQLASARAQRDAAIQRAGELAADRDTMMNQFKVLSEESLERQGRKAEKTATDRMAATQQLVTPLAEGLRQLNDRLNDVEKERSRLAAELGEQVRAVKDSGETIRREALNLSNALRTPQVRGAWGEQSLRRIVEISGLTSRCDFDDQFTYTTTEGDRFRPDMRINLSDGKIIFVDSKVPLSAVLEAYNTEDEAEQKRHLGRFSGHVRKHIEDLSGKNYWQLDSGSPEFVVLFLGSDEFYRLAQEQMPDLHEFAARRNIMLACPGTLIPMLHIVAHGWKQAGLAESAAEVTRLGRELHERISTMGEHFDKLGRSINSTVGHFNKAVGTLESRVMVTARKFRDLQVTDSDLQQLTAVDTSTRDVVVPEMLEYHDPRTELSLLDDGDDVLETRATVRRLTRRTGTNDD
ncbi:DNA recombination protein RmuC [Tessaracoccus antarcticus]|uniref:DNA recombination protein RmuC n=1 Tax=Tessaracoccus antarcticus TaxID=2479848 RepID=A0A3M0GBF5_9ACTN|nr:DNA recombination protein RmuC [Tessaracoccus antarcticus]RMB62224.1 DNA recombination protein RmuC [Tessaracoccus antarcticus]